MSTKRRHDAQLKFTIALEALRGEKSVADICAEYHVAPAQVYAWKKLLEERGALIFADKRKSESRDKDIEKLHAIIGGLIVEKEHSLLTKYQRMASK